MTRQRLSRLILLGGLLMALGYVLLFLFVVSRRILYPYEVEWVEDAVLLMVKRILAGEPLYTAPSLDYIPLIYPPLYMYASAGVALLTGPTFFALRLLSLVSTILTVVLLAYWLYKETGDWLPPLVAVGFYAGAYRLNGTWYDVGRVDAFNLWWIFLGFYLLRHPSSPSRVIGAALAFLLAFWTKQTTLFVLLPLLAYAAFEGLFRRRRSYFHFLVAFLVPLALTFAVGWVWTQGWLGYYLFVIPSRFPLVPFQVWHFWKDEVLGYTGLAFAGLVLYLWWEGVEGRWKNVLFFGVMFLGLVGNAWSARSHAGSYTNDLMPVHLAMALGWGLFLGGVRSQWVARYPAVEGGLALVILLQMIALLYNPFLVVPPPQNMAAGQKVIARIAQIQGDVFVPYHPYLAEATGKRVFAHMAGITDVLRADPNGWGKRLRADLEQAIREKRFAGIVLEQRRVVFYDEKLDRLVEEVYGPPEILFRDNVTFRTITGWRIRPERVYER